MSYHLVKVISYCNRFIIGVSIAILNSPLFTPKRDFKFNKWDCSEFKNKTFKGVTTVPSSAHTLLKIETLIFFNLLYATSLSLDKTPALSIDTSWGVSTIVVDFVEIWM